MNKRFGIEKRKGVGCFIEYNNKFLILLRPKTNEWGLVGGKIETNESPTYALLREIVEEIGVDASKEHLEFCGNFNLQYPDGDWDFYTYRLQLEHPISPQLKTSECTDYQWVTPEECFSMPNLMQGLYVLLKEVGYIKDGHLS